uniref:RING-type domain-containing protein n=1 Tax=Caenorhabditis japonica TaxID=281687 RepID=A0A8R1E1I5_CAEJA
MHLHNTKSKKSSISLQKLISENRLLKKRNEKALRKIEAIHTNSLEELQKLMDVNDEKLIKTTMDLSLEKKKSRELQVEFQNLKMSEETLRDIVKKNSERIQKPSEAPRCEICDGEYADDGEKLPIVLNCGHTLCLECVYRIAGHSYYFCCPFDRRVFKLCKHGAKCLIKNYALIQMVNRRCDDENQNPNQMVTSCCEK